MKGGEPFTLGGLWENWKDPESGDWVRTFTIIPYQRVGGRTARPNASDHRSR
jgi:putative SOS response-associated peptidase YedK